MMATFMDTCSSRVRLNIGMLLAMAITITAQAQVQDIPIAESGSGWRYESIDMDVELHPGDKSMTVRGTARLRLEIEASSGPTFMLRRDNGESKDSEIVFTSIESVQGETTMFNVLFPPQPGVVLSSIRAQEPFARGDAIDIEFEIQAKGKRNQFVVHPEYATASWTSTWYPVPAPGPGEGFGAGLMLTTGTVRFHMPSGWSSVCVGDMTSRTEDGDRAVEEWTIEEARAIGFAAGPFTSSVVPAGDRMIGMFRLSAGASTLPDQAQTLSDAIDAMSDKFGAYPYSRFSIAEAPEPVPGFWAASEQGFILAKPDVFTEEGGNIALFAHEAAHAWWGNLVDLEGPGGIFLSESLSQYGAVIAIEAIEGQEAATDFLRFSRPEYIFRQCARGYFQIVRDGDDSPISTMEHGGGVNHQISDAKGHWVHHMLRRRMGDDAYFGVLRAMVDHAADRSFTLKNFREACIEAAPEARLEIFFEQWLDRTGAPEIEFDWEKDGDSAISITIRQAQSELPYDLDLEIELTGVGQPIIRTVHLTDREQTFSVEGLFSTVKVRLDPQHKLLRWTPEYGTRPSEGD